MSESSLSRRLATGLKATLVAQAVRMLTSGALVVLLTRYLLDPTEYGMLFLAISVFGVVQVFADLGLAKSAARYVAELRKTDPGQVPHVLRTTLGYNLLTAAVVAVLFALTSHQIARLIGQPALTPLLALGSLYVVGRSFNIFSTLLFQGFNRVAWSALVNATANVFRVVAVVVLVFAGFGTVGALGGYVLSYGLAAVFGLGVLYVKFYATYPQDEPAERGLSRRILEYSVPLTATRGANTLDKKIDTILVGFFLNPVAVGYYVLAKQISAFLLVPAASLGFTISPTYGGEKAANRLDRAARLYETSLRYVLLLYLPAAAGLILIARPMIHLVFGSDYAGAVAVVQVMSLSVVAQAIVSITSDGLDYLGRARARAVVRGSTAVANFLLNLILIPTVGVIGAAVATVVTQVAYVLVNLYLVQRELPVDTGALLRTGVLVGAITLGMGVSVFALVPFATSLVTLFSIVLLGVAVWVALSVLSGVMDVGQVTSFLT